MHSSRMLTARLSGRLYPVGSGGYLPLGPGEYLPLGLRGVCLWVRGVGVSASWSTPTLSSPLHHTPVFTTPSPSPHHTPITTPPPCEQND